MRSIFCCSRLHIMYWMYDGEKIYLEYIGNLNYRAS